MGMAVNFSANLRFVWGWRFHQTCHITITFSDLKIENGNSKMFTNHNFPLQQIPPCPSREGKFSQLHISRSYHRTDLQLINCPLSRLWTQIRLIAHVCMNSPTDSCTKSTDLGLILYPSILTKQNLTVCWHEKEEKWATLMLKWFDVEMQRHAAKQSKVFLPAVLWTYRTEKPQQAQFLIYKLMLCTDLTYITELLWTALRSDEEWSITYLNYRRKS